MSGLNSVVIATADFSRCRDASALRVLMQHYASDPMGGAAPLPDSVIEQLPFALQHVPGAFSALAWRGDQPVGLLNAFAAFSTFRAQPVLNIHDVVVVNTCRGLGLGRRLLQAAEDEAIKRGCCKLTLEVLSGNSNARGLYADFGFSGYELDPTCGQALFLEKKLTPST